MLQQKERKKMCATIGENTKFVLWFLMLMACVGLGATIASSANALAVPGILLPFVFIWLTSFVPAAGPMYKALSSPGWPCSPRMMVGMLVAGIAVIYAVVSLSVGWSQ
jgi:hypothetical protein